MPSDQDMRDDELDIQVTDPDESVDDTQDTKGGEGESDAEVQVTLDDEVKESKVEKLTPAQENAKRQEEAWLQHVTSGNKEVEDAPKWLQPRLTKRLDNLFQGNESNIQSMVSEEVNRQKAADQEAEDFKSAQSEIPPMTSAQATEFKRRYNELKPVGRGLAIRRALESMGLRDINAESKQMREARGDMSLPKSGQSSVSKADPKTIGGVPVDVINDEKKWAELVRTGGQ